MKRLLCEHLNEVKADMAQTEKNEALWKGVERNDPVQVTFYLAAGADVTADNHRAVRLAAKAQAHNVVSYLLEAGADPTANSYEAFKTATKNADVETMKWFLSFLQAKDAEAARKAVQAEGNAETSNNADDAENLPKEATDEADA